MTVEGLKIKLDAYPGDMPVCFDDYKWGNTPIHNIESQSVFDDKNNMIDVLVLSQ